MASASSKPAAKIVTMSPTGQIVVPKRMRERFGLEAGPVQVEIVDDGVLVRAVRIAPAVPASKPRR